MSEDKPVIVASVKIDCCLSDGRRIVCAFEFENDSDAERLFCNTITRGKFDKMPDSLGYGEWVIDCDEPTKKVL